MSVGGWVGVGGCGGGGGVNHETPAQNTLR